MVLVWPAMVVVITSVSWCGWPDASWAALGHRTPPDLILNEPPVVVIGTVIEPSEWTMRADVVVSGAPPPRSSESFMTTLLPLATGVTEITWLVTVPCSPLSLSTYTHLFPTLSGKKATVPLPVDREPEDPESEVPAAEGEPAAAGWLDVAAVLAPELFPQPARASPEAAAAARMPATVVREVKPDLFMSCLGLGVRSVGDSRLSAAGR